MLEKEKVKLGARIKQLRIEAGFTNADDFAFEHSFTPSAYRGLERGGNIEYNTLIRILNSHGLTYIDFFSKGFD